MKNCYLLSFLVLFTVSCSSFSKNNTLKDFNPHKKRTVAHHDVDTIIEGKSDYICTVNFEKPENKGNYSQTIFSREVFTDGKTHETIYIHNRKVIETPTPSHPDSIFINFSVNDDPDASIYKWNIYIDIGKIDQNGNSIKEFSARGRKYVSATDYTNKMLVVCFHKSIYPDGYFDTFLKNDHNN